MARKTINYTVETEGRDKGKTFQLTEMSAAQAERWAFRAFRSLATAGVDIGEVANAGMQGIALLGFRTLSMMPFSEAEPLLDEMFSCVTFKPDPKHPNVVRPLIDDDIEEVSTRLLLRSEVFKMHVNFSRADSPSTLAS